MSIDILDCQECGCSRIHKLDPTDELYYCEECGCPYQPLPEPPVYCSECERDVQQSDMSWVYDNYGNPFKKVCSNCYDSVRQRIGEWVFDSADAG